MKILHVIATMRVGGAQRLIADLIPRFNQHYSNDVLVFLDTENALVDSLRENAINVFSLHHKNIYNPVIGIQLIKYIKQYDVVHVHLFPTIYFAAIASFFCKSNLVYTEHSTKNRRRGKWYFKLLDKLFYSRYKKIISISEGTEAELKKWLNVDANDTRFITINNGTDIKSFRNIQPSVHKDNDLTVKLMMVGRFAQAKDQDTIIRALAQLESKYHLYLVGDGPRIDACKELATDLHVGDRVHFLGMRGDVPQLVASCDIGIQSSHWEGFGLTAVELMAAGKPVIASRAAGLQQVVEGAGLLFDIGDDNQLAEHIRLLAEDKDFYTKIADQCSKRADAYDINIMAEKYLQIYKLLS